MRLAYFSVRNYRSIRATAPVPMRQLSTIVGRNNEGKSNFLFALRTALGLLAWHVQSSKLPFFVRYEVDRIYSWQRDYPVALQARSGTQESTFRLDFAFDEAEVELFQQEIGSKLNGDLPLSISIGQKGRPVFRVMKQGKGGSALSAKAAHIANFIGSRLQFTYVEAVRTDRHSKDAVNDIVERELASLESNPDYMAALDRISGLQEPLLKRASDRISSELGSFIPEVRSVSLKVSRVRRSRALREAYDIEIDDGTLTPLEQKGDGIKSLAAISLLKGAPIEKGLSFLALEEPESHLHPGAIHKLRKTLVELSDNYQIALSTHSPVFVNRSDPSANIIVEAGKVAAAKSIKEIRECLGVRPSDNLVSASLVVVVEGLSDCRIVEAMLGAKSARAKSALAQGLIQIKNAGGVERIPAQVLSLSQAVADVMCVVDGDEPGKRVAEELIARALVQHGDVSVLGSPGMKHSEIEDLIDGSSYESAMQAKLGVNIGTKSFKKRSAKWSLRLEKEFQNQGLHFTESTLVAAKTLVADAVVTDPLAAVHVSLGNALQALCDRAVARIETLTGSKQ